MNFNFTKKNNYVTLQKNYEINIMYSNFTNK